VADPIIRDRGEADLRKKPEDENIVSMYL